MKKHKFSEISMLLYLLSMVLPVFGFDWEFLGFQALTSGWLGFLEMDVFVILPWLANFLYITNFLVKAKRRILRLWLSIITVVFSLFTFGYKYLPTEEGIGPTNALVGIGFLCWFLSFVFLLIDRRIKVKSHS